MTGVRGPAATGLGKQLRAAQARVVVPFEDNRHLNRLLGEYDGHLALLEERLGIEAQAHGNVVTLTGPTAACETARDVLEKLYARIRQGEDIGPGDVDGLLRHVGGDAAAPPTASPRSARAAASSPRARRCRAPTSRPCESVDLVFGVGPAGHRQDLPRRRLCRAVPRARAGRPHRAVASGRRGGRAAGLPAGRHAREGRSLPAPAVRRALRRAAASQGRARPRDRRHRDRAARLHARTHAGALLRHPRRSAEHHQHADEDVPDPHRRRLQDGGDGRPEPDRPAAGPAVGPGGGRRPAQRAYAASRRCASRRPTWCAATWWPASSKPTTMPARSPSYDARCGRQPALALAGRSSRRSRSHPERLSVTLVEEDGDWSGFRCARGGGPRGRCRAGPPSTGRAGARQRGERRARPATRWCAASIAPIAARTRPPTCCRSRSSGRPERDRRRSPIWATWCWRPRRCSRRRDERGIEPQAPSPASGRARSAASAGLRPSNRHAAEDMERLETDILATIGVADPYAARRCHERR